MISNIQIKDLKTEDGKAIRAIVESLNEYLKNNKGAVPDFNLVKDIVERNTQALESEITAVAPVPLYIGLFGTMLGIFVGLLGIDLSGDIKDISPQPLLNGVTIAMIASMCGLTLTTLLSSLFFRKAQSQVEKRKNDFYTFIQINLLPILEQNVTASLSTLQNNLSNFSISFSQSVIELKGSIDKNHATLQIQSDVLANIEKIDLVELTKSNINTYKQLGESVGQLKEFNKYITNLTSALTRTDDLTLKLGGLISSVDDYKNNVENIGNSLSSKLETADGLFKFLNTHYVDLEARGDLINKSIAKVDDEIKTSLDDLGRRSKEHLESVFRDRIESEEELTKVISDSADGFAQLNNLKDMKTNLELINTLSASSSSRLQSQIKELSAQLQELNTIMNEVKSNNLVSVIKSVGKALGKPFKK